MVGATPVFADVDLGTFNITPETIESVVTPRTRAVIPVHQFGLAADMDGINECARRHGLQVIEDAACAIGSRYRGRHVGALGSLACFSFHPRKVITTGEGGMLVTDDDTLASRARTLINHGASVPDVAKHNAKTLAALSAEEFHDVGYNYRMTSFQGAIGVCQMKRLDDILESRRVLASRYNSAFAAEDYLIPPHVPDYAEPNWQSYAVRVADLCPVSRDEIVQRLLAANISCRPGYMACHSQPAYRSMHPAPQLPNTEKALSSVIILPLHPQMTDDQQDHVITTLLGALRSVGGLTAYVPRS
jgi:dTDP-4-amino-4,6-dideoxygalactose transaminase